MTHRLGNNRTDKLQGTRRSQARGRGRRRRPDVPGGPGGSRSTPPSVQGAFLKRTETPTTSLALARRPPPPARPPPTFAALPAAGRPRTCRTMSWARRPKPPALPRAPEPEPRPERGAQAERAARGPGRPRLSPPPPLRSPTWRGPRVRSVQRGAELGRGPGTPPLRQGRGGAPEPRRGVPLPFACPQLPDAPSPHPTTRLKFTLAGRAGSGFPLHLPAARLTLPRASSRIRAGEAALGPGRPFLPGAGWRSPRIELVGLLRRTFFSLRRPQHRAQLGSGSLRAGKSPGLTPSSPARSRRLRRGSGAGEEGAGRSRRERGGAAARPVDKARGGVRRAGAGLAGRGGRRARAPREAGPGRPPRTPPPGPGSGAAGPVAPPPAALAPACGREAERRRRPCGPIWIRCPRHPAPGR